MTQTLPAAFFERLDADRFRATAATVGPWDPRLCHGSPPATLLAHAIASFAPRDDVRVGRISFDFHGPVPVGDLSVEVSAVRTGARVDLHRARIVAGGRTAMEASAWRISTSADRAEAVDDPRKPPALPGPQPQRLFADVPSFGYGMALEWRFFEGAFDSLGPAGVWARARIPLIEGAPISPLGQVLVMVDSANGISAVLPPSKYTFVPVELTVSLRRHPETEWVGMRAETFIEADGIGQTRAELFDERGYIGLATQTLFVGAR